MPRGLTGCRQDRRYGRAARGGRFDKLCQSSIAATNQAIDVRRRSAWAKVTEVTMDICCSRVRSDVVMLGQDIVDYLEIMYLYLDLNRVTVGGQMTW